MLASQLEITQQALDFLHEVNKEAYCAVSKPHFSGSAGAHMRHILDHYLALMAGVESGYVDYNKRNRFADFETDPLAAIALVEKIEAWLPSVCTKADNTELWVTSETSIQETNYVQVKSTLARELVFVSSHAIHHFALLGVMWSMQGKSTGESFGVAPSTATYRRQPA